MGSEGQFPGFGGGGPARRVKIQLGGSNLGVKGLKSTLGVQNPEGQPARRVQNPGFGGKIHPGGRKSRSRGSNFRSEGSKIRDFEGKWGILGIFGGVKVEIQAS